MQSRSYKGLSGGRIAIHPHPNSGIIPEESMIVGNTVLYGAIDGECYFRGIAGERFAVRNSGAIAVIEGAGDHCCEYMTGGVVAVLGETGLNFGAGMTGGFAYVLDIENTLAERYNDELVELVRIDSDVLSEHALYLKVMIEDHVRETGSTWGNKILDLRE